MATFHDDKLWQEAYVALLDLLEITDGIPQNDMVDQIRKHGMMVLTVTADGVSRKDRRERDAKLRDVGFIIVALRSLLSVMWGQKTLTDAHFSQMDSSYEAISGKLPR